jgi:hypothetical protein
MMIDKAMIENTLEAISDRLLRADNYWERDYHGEGGEFDKELATDRLREAWLLALDLLNQVERPNLLQFATERHKAFVVKPLESRMGVDDPFLVHSGVLSDIVESLRDVYLRTKRDDVSGASIEGLLATLRRSVLYITSPSVFGFLPAREEDVHQRIQGLLRCSFHDAENRPPMPSKVIKSFIPDTGIKSLRALIDYKFITNEAEAKTVLGEVYEDISGYQSDDYDTFIFVIYETTRAFHESEWKSAIARSKPGCRVEVIVLQGMPPTPSDLAASEELMKKKKRAPKPGRRDGADAQGEQSATTPAPKMA